MYSWKAYAHKMGAEHLKKFGQFFTPEPAARFMVGWACRGAETVLDPAAGNSIFLALAREQLPQGTLTGWELDPGALDYFGNPAGARLRQGDYLSGDWEGGYDAIVCNPPYSRFQGVEDRERKRLEIQQHSGCPCSGYTNLAVLFLLKSICQLSDRGRLAYLMPWEFFNSDYGIPMKRYLLEQGLLRAVIAFSNDKELFPDVNTTVCIVLLDRTAKRDVTFYALSGLEELETLDLDTGGIRVEGSGLDPEKKWRCYLRGEEPGNRPGLPALSQFGTVRRGTATGANGFYCLTRSRSLQWGLPQKVLTPCLCRSADVSQPVFTRQHWEELAEGDRPAYVLDIRGERPPQAEAYLREGERQGVDRAYIPARRHPWYSLEDKKPAPIWISSACRTRVKVVRNLAGVRQLTTFHGLYVRREEDTDLLFCALLAPCVQRLLLDNRKELGRGLYKFQPGDLNQAPVPDLDRITLPDRRRAAELFEALKEGTCTGLPEELDRLFRPYLEGPRT